MVATYAPLLLMFALAGLVVMGFFVAGHFLGPKNPSPAKLMPFESGNESPGARKIRMSVKFYLTAILFVVFDIEAVFLYVWAVRFRALGWVGMVSMVGFLAVLVVGLVYALRKGALEWEK
ncbi:MAG: NADH-quinone oxidoreductase subunit A [Deltaproteobacteria bacterium]|nr:NADH-quinone oxidoreductase subunit A [Deltaproteobacteria bacterium]